MSAAAPVLRLDDFAPLVHDRLARAAALGRRRREAVYLVGGLVRDRLLGVESLDVDLVVEGDALAFARDLATELSVPFLVHPEFRTARLDDPALGPLDVATSRRESYSAPAALPAIESAPIAEDLGRRDFAVNALALRLDRDDFLDPWDGLRDLAARRLRILHGRSFLDDPTRILRGVRLGARLGFDFDAEAAARAKKAVDEGAFRPLSGSRLAAELELLAECSPRVLGVALDRLATLGFFGLVLGLSNPAADASPKLAGVVEEGDRLLRLLLVLTAGQDEEAVADRLLLSGERRARLVGAGQRARAAREGLDCPSIAPHEAHQLLAPLGPDELALLTHEPSPVGAWAVDEQRRMRTLTLGVQGRDLVAAGVAPGPRIGQILSAIRRERLDGLLKPEGERARALELVRESAR